MTSLLHFRLIQALVINTIHIINKLRNCILYKVYQLLAHGRWVSPGTPASSTTKTGRHDIAEILLKVALKHQKSNQIKKLYIYRIVLNDRDSDNMSLVPCNFDSEYTEDELTVWILNQHFIAETVAQQPPFLGFLYDTNHVF